MPDWSYRTLFQPVLFRLPFSTARDLCLGSLGRLGAMPGGSVVIDLLGHMRPEVHLSCQLGTVTCLSPVGLGAGLDLHAIGLPALARFGVGFIEVGPVTAFPIEERGTELRAAEETLRVIEPLANPGVEPLAAQLKRFPKLGVPVWARIACRPGQTPGASLDELRRVIASLAPVVQGFSISLPAHAQWEWSSDQRREFLRSAVDACRASLAAGAVLICFSAGMNDESLRELATSAIELAVDGIVVTAGDAAADGSLTLGRPGRNPALETVRRLRNLVGPAMPIVGSGGVHEPQDALDLLHAGANLVQLCSGLAFAGPGLPKRINEAVAAARYSELRNGAKASGAPSAAVVPPRGTMHPARRPPEETWFWTLLLGVALIVGGFLAFAIASTRVVLPYDEAFCGVSREQLASANSRILHFMTHDRVSLAGTMFALGVLYAALSWFALRRGVHWARMPIMASAMTGFISFFMFLGFGYLDTFHAFVSVILLQFMMMALHARLATAEPSYAANLHNDWKWQWSLWGQLLFVIEGCGLIGAGLTIGTIGCTQIFVKEDLAYLGSTAAALATISPNLLPLIAHDRASFGGMLVCCGICVLLTSLWGFRQGERWLWWTLLVSGASGYVPAIATHFMVGYTDLWHLTPAYIASVLLVAGLVLTYPYLTTSAAEWRDGDMSP